jgi:hypothetical protein
MPDIPLKPEDWNKFRSGLQSDDTPEVSSSPFMPSVEGGIGFVKGLGFGIGKGVTGMIPESIEGKTVKDWSSSPGEGGAESAGEWTGDAAANIAPFFIAPELGIAAKGGELISNAALAARTAGKIGQTGYKAISRFGRGAMKTLGSAGWGAASGEAEGMLHNEEAKTPEEFAVNSGRGAVEGGVTSAQFTAGRLAYEALPPAVKRMAQIGAFGATATGAGMLVWDQLGHHHYIPYHLFSALTAPVLGLASGATKLRPAIVGAAAERAAQGAGYEPTSKPDAASETQDEIIGQ